MYMFKNITDVFANLHKSYDTVCPSITCCVIQAYWSAQPCCLHLSLPWGCCERNTLQCIYAPSSGWVFSEVKVAQSCLTLCKPMDYTVHGILQARMLEWAAFPFSRGSSQARDRIQISHIAGRFFTNWTIRYQYWGYFQLLAPANGAAISSLVKCPSGPWEKKGLKAVDLNFFSISELSRNFEMSQGQAAPSPTPSTVLEVWNRHTPLYF